MAQQLITDGFILKNKDIAIEINDNYLKIDGDKQSSTLHTKYKRLIEIETGITIQEGTQLNYKVSGKEKRKLIKG